jgi:hypothetical protein
VRLRTWADAVQRRLRQVNGPQRVTFAFRARLRVECKVTEKDSFTFKLDVLDKIKMEALKGMDETWALHLKFHRPLGMSHEFAIVEMALAEQLGYQRMNFRETPPIEGQSISVPLTGLTIGVAPLCLVWRVENGMRRFAILPWSDFVARLENHQ